MLKRLDGHFVSPSNILKLKIILYNWFFFLRPNVADDSSSDGIEFVNSDGEIIEIDEENEIDFSEKQSTEDRNFKSPKPEIQIMCIQMEFCDKSTLR